MAYVFTLLYILLTLITPGVFPQVMIDMHLAQILGWITIVSSLAIIGEAKLKTLPESTLVLGILVAIVVSVVAQGYMHALLYVIPDQLPRLLVFYFVLISCRTLKKIQGVIYSLMFISLFIFANAALAAYTGDTNSLYVLRGENGSPDRWQGLGFLSDPNDTAQLFATVIPMFWLRWRKSNHLANFFLTLVPAVLLAIGIYYTHSRGGLVALIAVVLFALKDKLGLVRSSILSLVLLIGLVAVDATGGRSMNDDDGRVILWRKALSAFKTHPLFGVGVGNFTDWNYHSNTAHNSFLLCLAELGLFGYFFWMGTIVSCWTGLTEVLTLESAEEEAYPNVRAATLDPHKPRKIAPMKPWLDAPALNRPAAPAAASAMAGSAFHYAPPGSVGWMPAAAQFNARAEKDDPAEAQRRLFLAAKIFRISFVGLLTSSVFLSRTFSMVLFIVVGMSAALHMIILIGHPEQALDWKAISRRNAKIIVASILILYALMRLRG